MSEFSTTALLEAQVDQSSLRSARQTVEDELGGIEVDVAAIASNGLGGGSGGAGGSSLATSMLETTNQHLNHISDVGDELADLAQERNHLLRENLEANELAAQGGGGDGFRPRNLLGQGLGILGGLAVAVSSVNVAGIIAGAIGKIGLGVADLIKQGGRATINAADLVAKKAKVTAGDVVDSGADVGQDILVGAGATIATTALVAKAATIEAANVVDGGAEVGEDILVEAGATIATSVLVAKAATIEAGNLIDDVLNTTDILGEGFPIKPPDLIDQGEGQGSGSDSGSGSDTGDSSGSGISIPEIVGVGGGAAGLNALLSGSTGGLSLPSIGSSAAGGGLAISGGMFNNAADNLENLVPGDQAEIPTVSTPSNNNLQTIMEMVGSDGTGRQPGKVTVAPSADLSGGSTDFSEWETWKERNQDVEGRTGTARERNQVSSAGSSRGTPDRNETTVESPQIKNEIEVNLDLSNRRELKKFMRNPEKYIEDVVSNSVSGGL